MCRTTLLCPLLKHIKPIALSLVLSFLTVQILDKHLHCTNIVKHF